MITREMIKFEGFSGYEGDEYELKTFYIRINKNLFEFTSEFDIDVDIYGPRISLDFIPKEEESLIKTEKTTFNETDLDFELFAVCYNFLIRDDITYINDEYIENLPDAKLKNQYFKARGWIK